MLDDYQEVFAVAAFRLGFDPNTTDEAQLDQSLGLLEQQKPLLRKYTYGRHRRPDQRARCG